MKVLVLTGPESSGKSWLSGLISKRFNAPVVGEYVRYFIDQQQRDTCYADITPIAQGQLAWEDQARALQPPLLVLDTHLLSNILWSRTLFADCPQWLEPALLARSYHLHLLLHPEDVPWHDDGQRCQSDIKQRLVFFEQCEQWLQQHNQAYLVLRGNWQQRSQQALLAVEHWLTQS